MRTACVVAWACACAWARVDLPMQHATRMRHTVICGVSGSTTFSILSQKWQDFPKNIIEHKMCGFIFSTTLSKTFLILRRIQRDIVINVKTSLCKGPVIFVGF